MTCREIVLAFAVLATTASAADAIWPPPEAAMEAARRQWKPEAFPISFWCGPPAEHVTADQYKRIKEAGFTHVMPDCAGGSSPEGNKKILETAKQVGLKVFLSDARMPRGVPDDASRARIAAIVADYHDHPAFAGYFIGDEPGAAVFPELGQTIAVLRELDPEHVAYLNLYPNYAPLSALGTATYENYVQQFVQTVQPSLVSYDHYHFLKGADRPGFMQNLSTVRQVTQQVRLPFWQIVLAIDHFDYRPLSEAEKRFEAMQTLAYGGKGLMYFTYWQVAADGKWGKAIIDADGNATSQYEEVRKINRDVQAIGKYLLPATSIDAFEYGQPGDHTHTGKDVVTFAGPNVTVGIFADRDTRYALFANREYGHEVSTEVSIHSAGRSVEQLNKQTGNWSAVESGAPQDAEQKVPLRIAAGDAELYRWTVQ